MGTIDAGTWRQASRNVETVVKAGEAAMHAAMPMIGTEAVNVIKVLLTHPPFSPPGSPPGLRTGGLRLSYNYDIERDLRNRTILSVGSDAATRRPITGESVNYAKYLEFGTSKMAARPHLRPGMAIILPTIGPTLRDAAVVAQRLAAAGLKVMP